jgi:hypothetical protein
MFEDLIIRIKKKKRKKYNSYHKAFKKGYCNINFTNKTITWKGEGTQLDIDNLEKELIDKFGKAYVKRFCNDFKTVDKGWKNVVSLSLVH